MRRSLVTGSALCALIIAMTGCSVNQLPTYETVQTETESAMHLIVDELPNGSEVEDLTASAPFACAEGGVFFTGHWFVTPPQGFDTREFIETLPSTLSYDFAVEPTEVPTSYPSVSLRTSDGSDVSMDVSDVDPDSNPGINILALSRCAQDPGDGQNEN